MKRLIEWNPVRIFALSYLPCLTLNLLSLSEPYGSPDRSTLRLMGDIWSICFGAVYLGTIGLMLARELRLVSDRNKTALQERVRFLAAYVLLPLIGLLFPLRLILFPPLPIDQTIILAVVSTLGFIYPAYLTATSLTTIEYGRPTSFSENVGTCLALSFFPLSVFHIQPRVQRALRSTSMENDSSA